LSEEKKKRYVYVGQPVRPLALRPRIVDPQNNAQPNAQPLPWQQTNQIRDALDQFRAQFQSNVVEPFLARRAERMQQRIQMLSSLVGGQTQQTQKQVETLKCPECGSEWPADFEFCAKCGAQLQEERRRYVNPRLSGVMRD